jgi:dolichyl-phosphate beta-glucosyltransferase
MTTTPKSDSFVQEWLERQEPGAEAVALSVVVPAYNEEWRLPPTLIDMVDYFDAHQLSYEIIVVDDGSRDQTAEVARKFERIRSQIRLIRIPRNRGKGYAVRTGMLNAHGRRVLFADADGSTPIRELDRLAAALDQGADVAIGSRALLSKETHVKARWYRRIPGRIFNFCVNLFLLPRLADTQCGFKMFSAAAANYLFQHQQSDQFSFDLELLYMARQLGLKIAEVPVTWTHVHGSKVNLVWDALKMLKDIFVFRVRHAHLSPKMFEDFQKKKPQQGH